MVNNRKYAQMNAEIKKNIVAIILSAGKSERMGGPKFLLKYNHRFTFLEQLAHEYSTFGCSQVVVVLNAESSSLLSVFQLDLPPCTRILVNEHLEWQRFYSLKLAAGVIKSSNSAFVSNIDNPFVSQQLLETMLAGCNGCDYASPSFENRGGHPFFLSSKVVSDLQQVQCNSLNLRDFLASYKKVYIPVDESRILLNINTPADFRAAQL